MSMRRALSSPCGPTGPRSHCRSSRPPALAADEVARGPRGREALRSGAGAAREEPPVPARPPPRGACPSGESGPARRLPSPRSEPSSSRSSPGSPRATSPCSPGMEPKRSPRTSTRSGASVSGSKWSGWRGGSSWPACFPDLRRTRPACDAEIAWFVSTARTQPRVRSSTTAPTTHTFPIPRRTSSDAPRTRPSPWSCGATRRRVDRGGAHTAGLSQHRPRPGGRADGRRERSEGRHRPAVAHVPRGRRGLGARRARPVPWRRPTPWCSTFEATAGSPTRCGRWRRRCAATSARTDDPSCSSRTPGPGAPRRCCCSGSVRRASGRSWGSTRPAPSVRASSTSSGQDT